MKRAYKSEKWFKRRSLLKKYIENLDISKRNNICVEGIPGCENEGWDVTEEKLKKVIKDELDIENVVIEGGHKVKQNNDKNEDNDQTRKPPTVVAKLLHFKDKQDIIKL